MIRILYTAAVFCLAGCFELASPYPKNETQAGIGALLISDGDTYSFGRVTVGAPTEKTFTVSNTGEGTVTSLSGSGRTDLTYKGGAYPGTRGTCGDTLGMGESCTVVTIFSPQASGARSDSLVLTYFNGTESTTATREVSGTGITPAVLSISDGDTYDYGTVDPGSSVHKTFTISNTGESSATSLAASVSSSDFSFKARPFPGNGGTCGNSLETGASCTSIITFTPQTAGGKTDSLALYYLNGADSTTSSRALVGTGRQGLSAVGALDTSFNTTGIFSQQLTGFPNTIHGMTLDTTFKILTVGMVTDAGGLISRVHTDGRLDTSFKTHGYFLHNTTSGRPGAPCTPYYHDVRTGTNGQILVSGKCGNQKLLARYKNDGTLDSSFHTDGVTTNSALGGAPYGGTMMIATTGKYLTHHAGVSNVAMVTRYTVDGPVDTSFHTDGEATASMPNRFTVLGTAGTVLMDPLDTSFRITFVDTSMEPDFSTRHASIGRMNSDGRVDTTFTEDTINTNVYSGTVDGNQRIISFGGDPGGFAIYRFQYNGALDTAFRTDGHSAQTYFGGKAHAGVILNTGGFFVTGETSSGNNDDFGFFALKSDGLIDTTFHTDGVLTVSVGTGDIPVAIAARTIGSTVSYCAAGSGGGRSHIVCVIP